MLDAIDRERSGASSATRLGDLLLQVVFHAELAREAERLHDRRTSRVRSPTSSSAATRTSSPTSRCGARTTSCATGRRSRPTERARPRPTPACSATCRAPCPRSRTRRRSATGSRTSGFDWDDVARRARGPRRRARQSSRRPSRAGTRRPSAGELGDVLLTLTSVARHVGTSAELALRAATDRLAPSGSARRARGDAAASRQPVATSTPPSAIACGTKAKRDATSRSLTASTARGTRRRGSARLGTQATPSEREATRPEQGG